jgi:hypothetical protein
MEKKNFITLVSGTVSGLVFALGMCMCLLPEWNLFNVGVGCTAVGLIGIIATIIAFRKMSGAAPIKVNFKVVGKVAYGVLSALVLGLGMSLVMVFEGMMILGMVIGVIGIIMLLFLIPMCVGLKDSKK